MSLCVYWLPLKSKALLFHNFFDSSYFSRLNLVILRIGFIYGPYTNFGNSK